MSDRPRHTREQHRRGARHHRTTDEGQVSASQVQQSYSYIDPIPICGFCGRRNVQGRDCCQYASQSGVAGHPYRQVLDPEQAVQRQQWNRSAPDTGSQSVRAFEQGLQRVNDQSVLDTSASIRHWLRGDHVRSDRAEDPLPTREGQRFAEEQEIRRVLWQRRATDTTPLDDDLMQTGAWVDETDKLHDHRHLLGPDRVMDNREGTQQFPIEVA